jgi:hypothetical protein
VFSSAEVARRFLSSQVLGEEALLATKLYLPRGHPDLVPRPHLDKLLAEGIDLSLRQDDAPQQVAGAHPHGEYPLRILLKSSVTS